MLKRVAMISEHASPLAMLGGVDAGGQNVHVGQLARHLGALGFEVDVLTRRDSALLPETAEWTRGVRIVHIPAGPPEFVRKEDLLPHMDEFVTHALRWCRRRRHDIVHANFWMSGLVAAEVKRALGVPFVITFHALGRVRRAFQRRAASITKPTATESPMKNGMKPPVWSRVRPAKVGATAPVVAIKLTVENSSRYGPRPK